MVRSNSSWLFVCAGVVLFACSSSPDDAADPAGACTSYGAALEEGARACGRYVVAPEREAELAARLQKSCTTALGAPGSGITPSVLTTCADKLRKACGDADACDELETPGRLADGERCGADGQCASDDCQRPGASGCGVCVARVPIGGACGGAANGAHCARGATCLSQGAGQGTCTEVTKLGEGEVCYDPTKPGSSASCAEGLACKTEGGVSGAVRCAPRGVAGAACASDADCPTSLACVGKTCGPPGPEGTPCTSSTQCASGACSDALGKCVAVQWIPAGGSCDGNVKRCIRGACASADSSGADRKCVDPIPDGAPCSAASSSGGARCDTYASCIDGKCQIFDPSTCQ